MFKSRSLTDLRLLVRLRCSSSCRQCRLIAILPTAYKDSAISEEIQTHPVLVQCSDEKPQAA